MTIEEFVSDHQARRRELKQKDDDIEFANKLVEKLRTENKQLKDDLTEGLDDEIRKEQVKQKYLQDEMNKPDQIDVGTDTHDLPLNEGLGGRKIGEYEAFEYGGEKNDPEKLKETIFDLSRKLKEAKEEIKNRPTTVVEKQVRVSNDSSVEEPVMSSSDVDQSLKR